ncbi:MAG: hypothetical protein U9N59_06075, partial [Campylobacterota bacterium]|nr:hypothetical protein [Campylobacterota bacterium]
MRCKLNKFIIILFYSSYLFGQNINYASHDIHTLTISHNKVDIGFNYLLMNDTVDILKIKESEFGTSTNFDSIGDLTGYELKLRYGITKSLMLSLEKSQQNIQYGKDELSNNKNDIFLRYNFFNNQYAILNSGISLDFGYVENKLNDFYFKDLDEINKLVNKIPGISDFKITPYNGKYFIQDKTDPNPYAYLGDPLIDEPYMALKDTKDESYYLRLLTGYYTKDCIIDFYIGYKQTKIKNLITANDELINEANSLLNTINLKKNLNRDEKMYMIGMNYTYETKKFIYEIGFEYDKFIRDDSLSYVNFN